MHNCTCCSPCQQQLLQLTQKYQDLLADYTLLRERTAIQRQTLQIYKEENVGLNAVRVQLQARVGQLQEGLQHRGVVESGREERKVQQLSKVIGCKNAEIISLKQEIEEKRTQLHAMGKKIEDLQAEAVAGRSRVRVLEGVVRNTTIRPQMERTFLNQPSSFKQTTAQTPKNSSFPLQQPMTPMCSHNNGRLQLINSRIGQLQLQNNRLRQKLLTHI